MDIDDILASLNDVKAPPSAALRFAETLRNTVAELDFDNAKRAPLYRSAQTVRTSRQHHTFTCVR
jgi:hypothetical protein